MHIKSEFKPQFEQLNKDLKNEFFLMNKVTQYLQVNSKEEFIVKELVEYCYQSITGNDTSIIKYQTNKGEKYAGYEEFSKLNKNIYDTISKRIERSKYFIFNKYQISLNKEIIESSKYAPLFENILQKYSNKRALEDNTNINNISMQKKQKTNDENVTNFISNLPHKSSKEQISSNTDILDLTKNPNLTKKKKLTNKNIPVTYENDTQLDKEKKCLKRLVIFTDLPHEEIAQALEIKISIATFKLYTLPSSIIKTLKPEFKQAAYKYFNNFYTDEVLNAKNEKEKSQILQDLSSLNEWKDTLTTTVDKKNKSKQDTDKKESQPGKDQACLCYLLDKSGLEYTKIADDMKILHRTMNTQTNMLKNGRNYNAKFKIELCDLLIKKFDPADIQNATRLNKLTIQEKTEINACLEYLKEWKNSDEIKSEQAVIVRERELREQIKYLMKYFKITREKMAERMGFDAAKFRTELGFKNAKCYSYEFKVKVYNILNTCYQKYPPQNATDPKVTEYLANLATIKHSWYEEKSCIKALLECFELDNEKLAAALNLPVKKIGNEISFVKNITFSDTIKNQLCALFDKKLKEEPKGIDIAFATQAFNQLKEWIRFDPSIDNNETTSSKDDMVIVSTEDSENEGLFTSLPLNETHISQSADNPAIPEAPSLSTPIANQEQKPTSNLQNMEEDPKKMLPAERPLVKLSFFSKPKDTKNKQHYFPKFKTPERN